MKGLITHVDHSYGWIQSEGQIFRFDLQELPSAKEGQSVYFTRLHGTEGLNDLAVELELVV